MANYQCAIRTNYFHVQVPELFRQFMARVYGTEGSVELWEDKDTNGQPVFAFGSYGVTAGSAACGTRRRTHRQKLTKRPMMNLSAAFSGMSGQMTQ